jgi:hypothetical protein
MVMTPEEQDLQYTSQHAAWQKDHDQVMTEIDRYAVFSGYAIDSDEGVIAVSRLFANKWESIEGWLETQGAVLAGGEYVGGGEFYVGKIKVATHWKVKPELITLFLLRWA